MLGIRRDVRRSLEYTGNGRERLIQFVRLEQTEPKPKDAVFGTEPAALRNTHAYPVEFGVKTLYRSVIERVRA